MSLFLSRVQLCEEVPAAALRHLLLPDNAGKRIGAGHKLVWTLFADSSERERDFLWREAEKGVYYILSRRPPRDAHGLFRIDPPKEFAPKLSAGDRLEFVLRANATVSKSDGSGKRGKPCDVVMAALHNVERGVRATARTEAAEREGIRWLVSQGSRHGFQPATSVDRAVDSIRVMGYRTIGVERATARTARLGILDFEGTIEVTDPARFVEGIAKGFGRAKAFGCGLMLIRRV